jgi:DNA-binding NarL/FixJ family response regulator
MKRVTVLLADDHMIVREGIRKLLELDDGLKVVGEAKEGREAVALAMKLRPDVVLMDIAMPRLNGLEATRQVLKELPTAKVLILSAHNDDAYLENATRCGAAGFLLKQTSAQNLCRAIHEVQKGETFFGSLSGARLDRRRSLDAYARPLKRNTAPLTPRELEVLQLVAEGKTNKETASELSISIKTVEKHREHLSAKLDLHEIAGLTRYAIAAGIIESSVQVTIISAGE